MNCICRKGAWNPDCPVHPRSWLQGFWVYLAVVVTVALLYAVPDSLKGWVVAAGALLFVVVTLPTESEPGRRRVKPSREKDQSGSQ